MLWTVPTGGGAAVPGHQAPSLVVTGVSDPRVGLELGVRACRRSSASHTEGHTKLSLSGATGHARELVGHLGRLPLRPLS